MTNPQDFEEIEKQACKHGWILLVRFTTHSGVKPVYKSLVGWSQNTTWIFTRPGKQIFFQLRYYEHQKCELNDNWRYELKEELENLMEGEIRALFRGKEPWYSVDLPGWKCGSSGTGNGDYWQQLFPTEPHPTEIFHLLDDHVWMALDQWTCEYIRGDKSYKSWKDYEESIYLIIGRQNGTNNKIIGWKCTLELFKLLAQTKLKDYFQDFYLPKGTVKYDLYPYNDPFDKSSSIFEILNEKDVWVPVRDQKGLTSEIRLSKVAQDMVEEEWEKIDRC